MTTDLRPRHAVATPHAGIREGRLGEAIFAENAWAVVKGKQRYLVRGLTLGAVKG